jgi:hypothetical protein
MYREAGERTYIHGRIGRYMTEDRKIEQRHRAEPEEPQREQRTFCDPHGQLQPEALSKAKGGRGAESPRPFSGGLVGLIFVEEDLVVDTSCTVAVVVGAVRCPIGP